MLFNFPILTNLIYLVYYKMNLKIVFFKQRFSSNYYIKLRKISIEYISSKLMFIIYSLIL